MTSLVKARGDDTRNARLWLEEYKATLLLGVPLIGAQLAQMSINLTDTIMIGWLGAEPLAASVLATQLFFLTWLAGLGFLQAVMPLAARSEGQGDVRGVRRASRMGLWVAIAYSTLAVALLAYSEDILLRLGQDPKVASLANEYIQILKWSLYPSLVVMALRSFLTSLEKAQIVLWATLLCAGINAVLDYALIFGHWGAPELGIVGAGFASVGSNLCAALILIIYIQKDEKVRSYEVFVRFWRADWRAFFDILRLGWPISLMLLAEAGMFSAAAIMMGWIGTLHVAAHGIAAQLAGTAFMIPIGLSNAAVVRVGTSLGRQSGAGITRAGWCGISLAAFIALFSGAIFWSYPAELIGLFLRETNTDAAAVLRLGVPLLFIAALFQVVDGIQVVAAGVLRGLSDTRTPMGIAFIGYWIIGIPMSYVLAFPLGWGAEGIWVGLALGLATSALLLAIRFKRRYELGLVRP
ncbi:MATE family efflux transporter [Flexibacterium corallicola]|uniref:MATE family efflux transporter n=1 Tax=Flexibacterium corallicola TaxID=3037259 RepID=UPI00286F0EF0|nr:MATE family efflux transporter [Pseudovibrio sp. M1P-2-3]